VKTFGFFINFKIERKQWRAICEFKIKVYIYLLKKGH